MDFDPFLAHIKDPPKPPPQLFKYVAPDRVDVVENLRIRFTPLLGTNDVFEARRTYDKFAGPRFRAALLSKMQAVDIEAELAKRASRELGIDEDAAKPAVKVLLRTRFGEDYLAVLQDQLRNFVDPMLDGINENFRSDPALLNGLSEMAALSLTEDPYSATMWAYYAAEGRGFVIAFRTSDSFFRARNGRNGYRLHKVTYFDGLLDEIFDDPYAALMSKNSNWSHEREWRVYNDPADADQVLSLSDQEIHLFDFPASAIEAVIVGYRSADSTIERLREALARRAPHATLRRIQPDRLAGHFTESPL